MAVHSKLRYTLLAAGLAATAGSVYWASQLSQGEPDGALAASAEPERPRPRPPAAAAPSAEPGRGSTGELDLKRLRRSPSKEPHGDLFRSKDFAPAAPLPSKPIARPGPAVVEAPPPLPPPPPPPLPFSYIGRLAEGSRTTVFLAAGDRNLVVRAGDVIDNTYKVEEIGQSALVLTYLPQNVKQTMPIGAAK